MRAIPGTDRRAAEESARRRFSSPILQRTRPRSVSRRERQRPLPPNHENAPQPSRDRKGAVLSRTAFTLIELLVVLVVLGLLIAIVAGAANSAIYRQRVANTRATMKNITLAIDQFATEDPLRLIYNTKDRKTFGPYPPYQLFGVPLQTTVRRALEPASSFPSTFYTLEERLWRDLGSRSRSLRDWVNINTNDVTNDDIRALYTYLRVYAAGPLEQVPQNARKMLHPNVGEYVNVTGGQGSQQDVAQATREVLGLYDAWGVPLDYMLYVKLEVDMNPSPPPARVLVVTDRIPVLRSRGISSDETAAGIFDPKRWIFSADLPAPFAAVNQNGLFSPLDSDNNGWVRAVALGHEPSSTRPERYGYIPEQDK